MPRPLHMIALMAAAVGGPYVASETDWGHSVMTSVRGRFAEEVDVMGTTSAGGLDVHRVGYANHSHHEVEKLRGTNPASYRYDSQVASRLGAMPADTRTKPMTGDPIGDIREVARFDITPDWVLSRFPRVTTILAETDLEGFRVPIVTGTRTDDIAGTLTYYFDRSGKLQRLTLHGFTGDPTRMVDTATRHYGLQHTPSLEAGVYTRSWNGVPVQFLRLTHAPVVYSDAIHQKFTVYFELNQPSLAYGISAEAKRIIHSDRGTTRW